MARNRVIYQSEALFVSDNASSTGLAKHEQLSRVQSANYSFNISRQDVNQYGALGRIDSIMLEAPTVSLDFSYLLTNGFNEQALGFANATHSAKALLDGDARGFASGHLAEGSGKNIYILTANEGADAAGPGTLDSVIGVGNAYLTDYSLDASVGSIPTVSVSMEALNINTTVAGLSGTTNSTVSGIHSPAIDRTAGTALSGISQGAGAGLGSPFDAGSFANVSIPAVTTGLGAEVTALRPGDISIDFGTAATDQENGPLVSIAGDNDGAHVQSVGLSFSLSRSPIERLGSRFPFARTVDFPVSASLNVSAIVNEMTHTDLSTIATKGSGVDIRVTFAGPGDGSAGLGSADNQSSYLLKNAKLESESMSSSIGSNKTVDLTFGVTIGGPTDQANNLFYSGANTLTPFA